MNVNYHRILKIPRTVQHMGHHSQNDEAIISWKKRATEELDLISAISSTDQE
jgi:hypothetical protein